LGALNGRSDGEGALDPDREPRFRYLFDQLPDAVVDVEFVDGVPFVRDVNEAFEETFGYEEPDVLDTPLNDLIVPDGHESEAEAIDEMAIRRGHDAAEVERATADGCRTFLFRGFTYSGGERERGFGIYTDITDRLEQERRLRVLHRVLRHNLRNEMTAITGYADLLLETASSSEAVEYASRIHEEATDVSKLGEQVRRIEQALDIDRTRVALDPDPLVREIADRFRSSCPEATIRITSNGDGRVIADELLKIAIENLVENAIEHHPDAATVEIELSPIEGGWFDIAIRDDGPGIPERERAVVGGDREITQLDHSMGLGLWVSRWVVRGVDGQLLFGDADTGAEVTIRLRRADEYPELE
jgi:PAS domain S-box-containing protein